MANDEIEAAFKSGIRPRVITCWPEMMRRKTAAQYLDMAEAAFAREVFSGRLPPSVMLGGREHWRKASIDRALDHLMGDDGRPFVPEYLREFNARYGQDVPDVQIARPPVSKRPR